MITIYGMSQSRAQRSLWAAEELGLEFEHKPIHFADDTKTAEYLAINPNGRIPTLVDGDLVLWESMSINLYLARKHGAPLQPKTEADEARATSWSFWAITELEPALMTMLINRMMLPDEQRDAAAADSAEESLARPLAVLDGALDGRRHLLGAEFTIADLNVASVLALGTLTGLDLGAYSHVGRWLQACLSRPAAQRARSR